MYSDSSAVQCLINTFRHGKGGGEILDVTPHICSSSMQEAVIASSFDTRLFRADNERVLKSSFHNFIQN